MRSCYLVDSNHHMRIESNKGVVTSSHIKDFDGGSPVTFVRFLTSDSSFASAFEDGTIRIWKRTHDAPVHILRGHMGAITRMIAYPDGTRLISASRDMTVRIWDTETGEQLYIFERFSEYPSVLNLSPDLSRLRTACARSGELLIWNLDDGSLISELDASQTGGVKQMPNITDHDGKMITCGGDGKIRTWTQDGSLLTTLAVWDEHEPIRGVVYIGEKLAVVAGSLGGWVQVWDWENQVPLFKLEEPLQMVYTIISDGKKVGVTSHASLPGPVESDAPRDWVSAVTSRIQVWDMKDIRKAAAKDK